jgi:hypothetical protein
MHAKPLFCELAQLVGALTRCKADPAKAEWRGRHEARIEALVKQHMPSGSGFDNGTTIDLDKSTEEKLVFHTSYHHTNDVGMYDSWTEHTVTVKPSLASGITLTINGRNRNEIKDYMHELFSHSLRSPVEQAKAT